MISPEVINNSNQLISDQYLLSFFLGPLSFITSSHSLPVLRHTYHSYTHTSYQPLTATSPNKMVNITRVALFLTASIASYAAPASRRQGSCLSAENAEAVATKYGELISAYNDAAADAILSSNFTDFSSGVNALINTCPVCLVPFRNLNHD